MVMCRGQGAHPPSQAEDGAGRKAGLQEGSVLRLFVLQYSVGPLHSMVEKVPTSANCT